MRIDDKHVVLNGLLGGSRATPYSWYKVELTRDLSEVEWNCIEMYKYRTQEFVQNIDDLSLPKIRQMNIDTSKEKARIKSNILPSRFREKSIYLDFRHFLADNEPSNFGRIANLVKKKTEEKTHIQKFIDQLKRQFLSIEKSLIDIDGVDYSARELVNLWFNTELFHSGYQEQIQLKKLWLERVEKTAVHELLFWSIINSEHQIKCLYACIKDLSKGSMLLNCPDNRIIDR